MKSDVNRHIKNSRFLHSGTEKYTRFHIHLLKKHYEEVFYQWLLKMFLLLRISKDYVECSKDIPLFYNVRTEVQFASSKIRCYRILAIVCLYVCVYIYHIWNDLLHGICPSSSIKNILRFRDRIGSPPLFQNMVNTYSAGPDK